MYINYQDLEVYGILLSLFGLEWIDMDMYVCNFMGMCPFSAWFRYGFLHVPFFCMV